MIEDEGQMIAESATILRYLTAKYGDDSHTPPRGTPAYWQHEALLDYVEASLVEVALQAILPAFGGRPVPPEARDALNRHLDYITQAIGDGPLLFGDRAMLADIQLSYIVARLARLDLLTGHAVIASYWHVLQEQPGYIAGATGKTGRILTRELVSRGHSVTALVREGSDTSVLPEGTRLRHADLTGLRPDACDGAEVVIFAAGSGDLTHYLTAKHAADEHVKASGLTYAILRPVALTDDGRGKDVILGDGVDMSAEVSRADVAHVLATAATTGKLDGQALTMQSA